MLLLLARLCEETGRYDEGASRSRDSLRAAASPQAAVLLARCLRAVGRYDEALAALTGTEKNFPKNPLLLGERMSICDMLARTEAAENLRDHFFEVYRMRWKKGGTVLRVLARDGPPAEPGGEPSLREVTDPAEMVVLARAIMRYEPQKAFRLLEAVRRQSPGEIEPALASGFLAYEKYHWPFTRRAFDAALGINPNSARAHVGMGLLYLANSKYGEAEKEARAALLANPKSVEGHCLLAAIRGIQLRADDALPSVRSALSVNPRSLEALALMAAHHLGRGEQQKMAAAIKRARAVAPGSSFVFAVLGEAAERKRLFPRAVEFAREAIRTDPEDWKGYYIAGMNLMRLGEEREAHRFLEKAFALNGFNVWCRNMLTVTDKDLKLGLFARKETAHFVIKVSKKEAPVYLDEAARYLESIHAELTKRYGFVPRGPKECDGKILIEILPTHNDFSARTVGLPGLGALGACFGPVVTMPSPQAGVRKRRLFHWPRVLRHEFMHVITLQATEGRIPRWLTEGFSLWEEKDPIIGSEPLILRAHAAGKFRPLSELEGLFLRPKSHQDLSIAYIEAQLLMRHFMETYGFERMKRTLKLYRKGGSDKEVLEAALGKPMAEIEKRAAAWLEQEITSIKMILPPNEKEIKRLTGELDKMGAKPAKPAAAARKRARLALGQMSRNRFAEARAQADMALGLDKKCARAHDVIGEMAVRQKRLDDAVASFRRGVKADPQDYYCRVHLGWVLCKQKKHEQAAEHLERARKIYPRAFFPPNSYQLLAKIYFRDLKDEKAVTKGIAVLEDAIRVNDQEFGAAKKLGEVLLKRKKYTRAALAFTAAVRVNPFAAKVRLGRAQALEKTNRPNRAVGEYRAAAFLADRSVEAKLGLARLLIARGAPVEARKLVSQALAIDGTNKEALRLAKELKRRAPAP